MMRRLRARSLARGALPAAILLSVGLGTVASLAAGAGASPARHARHASASSTGPTTTAPTPAKVRVTPGASRFENTRPTVTPTLPACTQDAQRIGYKSPRTSGSPQNSTRAHLTCKDGKVVRYGNKDITYSLPPSSYIAAGHKLFEENCSSCHAPTAQGSARAPSLRGVGPATVMFWITTGRMPATTSFAVQAPEKPPRLTYRQAEEVAAWINSLTPSAPYIPTVDLKAANLAQGASLFALNCAACHTITGAGDALAYSTYAPSLHIANAQQVAEAVRTGPGNMPRFTGQLTDAQVRDVAAYVVQKIQHPSNGGGFGLGGLGPVAEGFVALLFGVGGLMLVSYWIGDRSS